MVEDLKDESEPYRRMVMETIEKVRGLRGFEMGEISTSALTVYQNWWHEM